MVAAPAPPVSDTALRDQLSNLRALLVLSMLMTRSSDEAQILHLAGTALPSLACCRSGGVYVDGRWSLKTTPFPQAVRNEIEVQLAALGSTGGELAVAGEGWAWAYPLRSIGDYPGYLVVLAEQSPSHTEQFLLGALVQQTGAALANARLHAKERATAAELRETNVKLEETVRALERTMEIHERLTRVAVAGEGQEGIADAIHELTGLPVAIEDRFGNLRAWAGPARPEP